jgi:hypothetical protein
VLFSNDNVAQIINQKFEATWESVRSVPLVQINFGGGKVVTRTLHGNIATYLCNAEGQVLDILPGIYAPASYLQNLHQFTLLARFLTQRSKESLETRLCNYHRVQAEALKKHEPLAQLVDSGFMSKRLIENPIKLVLASAAGNTAAHETAGQTLKLDSPEDLTNWNLLAEDTRINESTRRQQIHEMLAGRTNVRPENVTKWLYREVLHADLDDPYLGLGSVLFANYPFKDKVERSKEYGVSRALPTHPASGTGINHADSAGGGD